MPNELPRDGNLGSTPPAWGLRLVGCGSATPATRFDNAQMERLVETSDEWIASRTGIRSRHLAAPTDSLSDLATQAAQQALDMAGVAPESVDLILLATSTADDLFGSAGLVQHKLGAKQAVAFDLTAACSGFVFALATAGQFLRGGVYQTVLVIGADVLSRWVDWGDRRTCVLFGDGAGALLLQAASDGPDGLLGFELRSDGSQNHVLNLAYQPQARDLLDGIQVGVGNASPLTMNGQEVYRFAVKKVPEVIEKALFRAGLAASDLDWLLLHQANQRIMDAVADRLEIPRDRVLSNVAHYGNTSAASIPLCLDEAVRAGQVKAGDRLALSGFGAGLSWGGAIVRWDGPR